MPKITIIGAGSASFGENTLSSLMRSERLRGSTLALVDRNPVTLEVVRKLAERFNREWGARFTLETHLHHSPALPGSDFVVCALEVGARENLWRQDFEIPLRHGVRQPYAENGGPGGFAHAARNIVPILAIAREMERVCPQAWFINFTNPMVRVCEAINRYTSIQVVGLCHQIHIGYCFAGWVLGRDLGLEMPAGLRNMNAEPDQWPHQFKLIHQAVERLDIRAAGTNHFTWIISITDRQTGEDLYPLFRERYAASDPNFEPLTRRVYEAFGLMPVPGDSHLCEYLPWVSHPVTKPWEKYNLHLYEWETMAGLRDQHWEHFSRVAEGEGAIDYLRNRDSEGALEMIEHLTFGGRHYHKAANRPNVGQIPNLPLGAMVETPVVVDRAGIHPVHVGPLPEPIAELCRRELVVAQLGVDAAVEGSREKALQCLLLDPTIGDLDLARLVLDDYLAAYRDYLPQFEAKTSGG